MGSEVPEEELQMEWGVVAVRIGQVVCAKVAELGVNASRAESSQNSWVHFHCQAARGTRAAAMNENEPAARTSQVATAGRVAHFSVCSCQVQCLCNACL